MKISKKILSVFLCVLLAFGTMSVAASAIDTKKDVFSFSSEDLKNYNLTDFEKVCKTLGVEAATIRLAVNSINYAVNKILYWACEISPEPKWENIKCYTAEKENILLGDAKYSTDCGEKMSLGHAEDSIITPKYSQLQPIDVKNFYIANTGTVTKNMSSNLKKNNKSPKADGVADDQKVYVSVLDDGTGNGLVALVTIDGIGVTSTTVRMIRSRVLEWAEANGQTFRYIGVFATHCHSGLDTVGVGNPLVEFMGSSAIPGLLLLIPGFARNKLVSESIKKIAAAVKEAEKKPFKEFQDRTVTVAVNALKEAVGGMTEGKLYYKKISGSGFEGIISDKRIFNESSVFKGIPDIALLCFKPTDENKKITYIANITCHPTHTHVKGNSYVSSDYIYYLDKIFENNGYNFQFMQGAVGQISAEFSADAKNKINAVYVKEQFGLNWDNMTDSDGNTIYSDFSVSILLAELFGEKLLSVKFTEDDLLKSVINVKSKEIMVKTDNALLHYACQAEVFDNKVYRDGNGLKDVCIPSEIGYIEFGNKVAFALFPAELYPEVFHSGGADSKNTWSGEEWESVKDIVAIDGVDLYCVCFANDYIGYVVPDNTYSGGYLTVLNLYRGGYDELKNYPELYTALDGAYKRMTNEYWANAEGDSADELLSAGKNTASFLRDGFADLVKDFIPENY